MGKGSHLGGAPTTLSWFNLSCTPCNPKQGPCSHSSQICLWLCHTILGVSLLCWLFFWGNVNKYLFIPDRAMRKKRGENHPYPIWQTNGFILLTEHGGGLLMFFCRPSSCTWIYWYFHYCLWSHALQSAPTSHSGCGLEGLPISQYVGLKLSLGHSNYQ